MTDSSLEVVEDVLKKVGSDESGIGSGLKKIHSIIYSILVKIIKLNTDLKYPKRQTWYKIYVVFSGLNL